VDAEGNILKLESKGYSLSVGQNVDALLTIDDCKAYMKKLHKCIRERRTTKASYKMGEFPCVCFLTPRKDGFASAHRIKLRRKTHKEAVQLLTRIVSNP